MQLDRYVKCIVCLSLFRRQASLTQVPPSLNVLAEIACNTDGFSTLCTAVKAAGLVKALSSGEWTVFAPTNKAFANLGKKLDAVLADKKLLTDVLLFHAVAGEVPSKDLKCKKRVLMANGDESRTICRGDSIFQKGAGNPRSNMPEIKKVDIQACNGILHVVDEVMMP